MAAERIHLNALQQHIATVLIADAQLQAIGASVYDEVPVGAPTPYLEIGEYTQQGVQSKDGGAGADVVTTLHAFTEQGGTKELNRVMDAAIAALTASPEPITLPGGALVARGRHDFSEAFKEFDERQAKLFRHGVLRIRWTMLGI